MSTLASRLRERVTIEQPQHTADGYGGNTTGWIAVATVYAHVRALHGTARETGVAGQQRAVSGYRVTIRKRDDVDASMRVLWNGRILMIHSLHEQGETLELLTYEDMV